MNILITGGASGLGKAITLLLAQDSKHIIYFTFKNSFDEASKIEKQFPNTKSIHCDFCDEKSVESLLHFIEQIDLDVLVNNAFTGLKTSYFHKTESEFYLQNFKNNILPIIKLTQSSIIQFRKKKFGKIINILSSYILNKPPLGLSEYVAQKNYLLSLSKSWAVENSKFNITSNCISPSFMLTELTMHTDERVIEEMINIHPLRKLLTPEEVAISVEYLINASQHVNGTNMIINSATEF